MFSGSKDNISPFHNLGSTGEEEEVDSSEIPRQKKPWGYTRHFCPVALKTSGVLWPGSNEISLRYAGPHNKLHLVHLKGSTTLCMFLNLLSFQYTNKI